MTGVHLHLLINHVPVFGTVFGLLLLVAAMLWRNPSLQRAALVTFVVTGLATLVAFLSGEPAAKVVEHLPGVAESRIHRHEEAADAALASSLVLAAVSLIVLILARGRRGARAGFTAATLVVALVAMALATRAANLGGQVRHTEILPPSAPQPAEEGGQQHHDD